MLENHLLLVVLRKAGDAREAQHKIPIRINRLDSGALSSLELHGVRTVGREVLVHNHDGVWLVGLGEQGVITLLVVSVDMLSH